MLNLRLYYVEWKSSTHEKENQAMKKSVTIMKFFFAI